MFGLDLIWKDKQECCIDLVQERVRQRSLHLSSESSIRQTRSLVPGNSSMVEVTYAGDRGEYQRISKVSFRYRLMLIWDHLM